MPESAEKEYTFLVKRLGERIEREMEYRGIDQKELADLLKVSQATISNVISGKTVVSIKKIFQILECLELDPLKEVSNCLSDFHDKREGLENSILRLEQTSKFICNCQNQAFHGYLGRYNMYFVSTNPYENKCIHGDLRIFESRKVCQVELQLETEEEEENFKFYRGYMLISELQQAAYIILFSEDLGEMNFLSFPYKPILTPKRRLECTMALAVTVSSGISTRVPTAHRIFLSREKIFAEKEELIRGQLLMNKSLIRISKKNFEELKKNGLIAAEFIDEFLKFKTEEEYYEIEEKSFKQLMRNDSKYYKDICRLRDASTAAKNNKINIGTIADIFHNIL